jgi:hypothetical protein
MDSQRQQLKGDTYRYPAVYRAQALFGSLLFGFIVLGSVIAEVEAIQNNRLDSVLHIIGFVVGMTVILLGLDFATRSLTVVPDGLHVQWALRRSMVPWPEVLGWHYLPLNLIHIRLRHGPGWYVWPLLEHYSDLLREIDAQRQADKLTS